MSARKFWLLLLIFRKRQKEEKERRAREAEENQSSARSQKLSRRREYQLENKTCEEGDEQLIGFDRKDNFRDI